MPKYDPKSATRQRIVRTEAYAERIRRQFAATVNEIIALKKRMPTETGQMYSFDGDTRKVQDEVEKLLRRLHSAVTTSIEQGITLEWEQANKECDWLVQSYFSKELLRSSKFAAWVDRNDRARQAFIARSEKGLNLSDRVWQSCRQLRDEMEMAITVAVGEGNDAGSISRQIRHCLNNPDDMFRRFRYKDEDGNWQRKWKKRIKNDDGTYHWTDYDINDYHTGRGVYRSSAKNAMRVARTETNIAYRRADHERWQKMDFVLGQRVQLSKNHPMHDICDDLAGDYPKDFVFDGWHPQCFCFVTPILVDEKEMEKVNEAFLRGEEYTPQGKQITDYPQGFKDFVRDNADSIAASRARGTEPYFVRNNPRAVDCILDGEQSTPSKGLPMLKSVLGESDNAYDAALRIDDYSQVLTCRKEMERLADEYGISTMPSIQDLESISEDTETAWSKYSSVKELVSETLANAYKDLQNSAENIEKLKRNKDQNHIIGQLEGGISSKNEIAELLNVINKRMSASDRWLTHGDVTIDYETGGNNGSNDLRGHIGLSMQKMSKVEDALTKVSLNRVEDITIDEAEAIHSLWHEVMHDRAKRGLLSIVGTSAEPFMELANEYVARNTIHEFYEALGVKSGIPHPSLMIRRTTCGYESYVENLQTVLNNCRLDEDKVLAAVKNHLLNEDYFTNKDGLIEGLRAGGIRLHGGGAISDDVLSELLDKIVDEDVDVDKIKEFLKDNNIAMPSRRRKSKKK